MASLPRTMRAAVVRGGAIGVEEWPVPRPGHGQVLARTRACGICGSDLHLFRHGAEMMRAAAEMGTPIPDITNGLVLGHEFVAEIVAYGPGTDRRLPEGARVCSVPFLLQDGEILAIGATTRTSGAYADYLLLTEAMLLPVADDLPDEAAALTEPVAVAVHAVTRGGVAATDAAVVVGCGPIGLAIISVLRDAGVQQVVAADFSPGRRALAAALGATAVVNPGEGSAFARMQELAPGAPVVVFECTGANGVLDRIIKEAPQAARIVVAGIAAGEDRIVPMIAIAKELGIQFVNYYQPAEFAAALRMLTEARINWQPLVTGSVGLDGVAAAFEALRDPERHAKILIQPGR